MAETVNNYLIQVKKAKKRFLTYDQQELIQRCHLQADSTWLYFRFLSEAHRMERATGDLQRLHGGQWIDANSSGEVMTVLDWLCDSREDRYLTGRWVNLVNQSHAFHRNLQEGGDDPDAVLFDRNPEGFSAACEALQGEKMPGADIAYAMELVDGLKIMVQLWHGDEEFSPRLRFLWDENTAAYLRYETTWYALGLLTRRIRENMP